MNIANCIDFNLPVTNFDDCAPDVNFSEIERVFIGGPKGGAFANIGNANEWTTRLSESTVSVDAIRALTVIGDVPAAAPVVRELSNGRRKNVGKDYTLNYTVDDISDANYAFFAALDDQPIVRLYGYETQGGKMYHYGNEGILVNHSSNPVLARGRDEIELEQGLITWRTQRRATRINSPIYVGPNGPQTPTTFDSILTFTALTTDNEDGVSGTVPAIDPDTKFEFNQITPQVGTPASMTIRVGAVEQIVVAYTSDYNGSPFRFTAADAVVRTGIFTNGTLQF